MTQHPRLLARQVGRVAATAASTPHRSVVASVPLSIWAPTHRRTLESCSRKHIRNYSSQSDYLFPVTTIKSLIAKHSAGASGASGASAASEESNASEESGKVVVHGWVRSIRAQKAVAFIDLDDGSALSGLQVVVDSAAPELERIYTGVALKVTGNVLKAEGRKQEIELAATNITILGGSIPTSYPLHKARVPLEHLRENQHFRSRTRMFGALWRIRSAAQQAIHDFFKTQEFIQVNTPILTSLDCEGGGEAFRVMTEASLASHLDHAVATAKQPNSASHPIAPPVEFFGKPVYATVSGQLHAEFLASALSRVYVLSPTFRAEKSMSTRHLAEFWMLEAEASFITTLAQLTGLIQGNIKHTISDDLQLFDQHVEKGLLRKLEDVASPNKPFASITYTDAIKQLEAVKKQQWEFPVKWGLPLQSEHEKFLSEKIFGGPVFVTDYPSQFKPFYMKKNHGQALASDMAAAADADAAGETVACTDLLMPKIGELVGGSLREDDYDALLQSIRSHKLSEEQFGWYLDLRKYGSVPHGGYGMGFERFLGYVTGMSNLRDLIPAPRAYQHCKF